MIRLCIALVWGVSLCAAPLENSELQRYFEHKAERISGRTLQAIQSRETWEKLKPKYREQLFEMLSLAPLPAKSELHAAVTGQIEREDFLVEKVHFQSMPGLYVTGNLYRPKVITGPLPAILYVCGHSPVKTNGISYGNKVAYQHHGAWFARNGYVCLIIDTIQLGEIEGVHHGTYREGMWWWNSRGYTAAGVEAWNCIRALDYLETRPEVDKNRFGVTGRSGGGAYSWWISALDERIKVSAPVAGITDLKNYVGDGVVEGHCDCMFFVNTYRWDYPLVAALVAPRPLLLCNSDKDTIFPLDGVIRTHTEAKKVYDLYGASDKIGLLITEGPHKDTQDLQLPVFRWFNRHLKGEDPTIEMAAIRFFTPQELKVFGELPQDERTSRIHESFVTRTPIADPQELRATLREKSFGAWPESSNLVLHEEQNGEVRSIAFDSEENVRLKLSYNPVTNPSGMILEILAEGETPRSRPDATTIGASVVLRGDGSGDEKKMVQIRRRYMLVGETLDGMRVWDIGRAVAVMRSRFGNLPLHIVTQGRNAANVAMYAALAETQPDRLTLIDLPMNEGDQPDYLNFNRFTTLREIVQQLAGGGFGKRVKISRGE